jgi:hypothetical protein
MRIGTPHPVTQARRGMAASYTERRAGGPSRWTGRVARGLTARPGRLVRVHGPRGQGPSGRPWGDTAAPPPLVGLRTFCGPLPSKTSCVCLDSAMPRRPRRG